jgi:arylsulfatase A-like enzyme
LVKHFEARVSPDAVHNNPVYAAMVSSLDESVGRVLRRLQEHGLTDKTLVIFTSDNGGLTQRYGKHDRFTENLPLRRGKGSAYEGGVRVPAIVRWPGVTKPGSVSNTPIMTIDYYPTLLEITGAERNQQQRGVVDGRSLVPVLRDPNKRIDRKLFWHYPHYHAGGDGPYSAVRVGEFRLIEFHEDQRLRLYNLDDDIGEQTDLSADHPDKAAELHASLKQWRESIAAQMPTPNPLFDPERASVVRKVRE